MTDILKDQLGLFSKKKPAAQDAPPPVAEAVPIPDPPALGPIDEPVDAPSPEAPDAAPELAADLKPIPGRPGEHYLFPPERKRPRKDMHFSRRMSDLVRRLQLLEREEKQHLELTLPQAHALHALMDAGSLRMQELAGSLGLAQSTVTRLVAPLKRMGLLDRRPDRNDGRATRAFLTEKGTAIVDDLETADRAMYQALLERLDPTRRAEVIAAVELLHEAVLDINWED